MSLSPLADCEEEQWSKCRVCSREEVSRRVGSLISEDQASGCRTTDKQALGERNRKESKEDRALVTVHEDSEKRM